MWMKRMQVKLRKMNKIARDAGESSGDKSSSIAENSNKLHMKKVTRKGCPETSQKNEWMHALNFKCSLLIGSSSQTAEFMLKLMLNFL